jgi:hypothetical protein
MENHKQGYSMAKIGDKNIRKLGDWDAKELRKLKINANNRIEALSLNSKAKMSEKHVLAGMEPGALKELILEIRRAEKALANQ